MTNRSTLWATAVAAVFLLLVALLVIVPLVSSATSKPLASSSTATPVTAQFVAVPTARATPTATASAAATGAGSAAAVATATQHPAFNGSQAASQEVRVQRDVPYCTSGGVALLMDVYHPAGSIAPAPVAVYVHGGGWTSGDKSMAGKQAKDLASRVYLVAAVNYRLAPKYKWPAQIEDVKCSIRYLRAHASELNIDPRHIGACGDSAGGHLVSMLGLAGPGAGFEGNGGWANQSSSVQAVVDLYGPSDLIAMSATANRDQIAMFLGATGGNAANMLRLASPVTYVRKDAPPFLILHGDHDPIVPLSQSQELYDKLHVLGVDAIFVVVKNGGHGFSSTQANLSPSYDQMRAKVVNFFDRHLR